jgi:hypothetical protein
MTNEQEFKETSPGDIDTDFDTLNDQSRFDSIEKRLALGARRMDRIEGEVKENTDMTRDVHEMLLAWRAGMSAIAKFGRGLAMVGRGIMKLVRWAGIVAGAGVAIWSAIYAITHGGRTPP